MADARIVDQEPVGEISLLVDDPDHGVEERVAVGSEIGNGIFVQRGVQTDEGFSISGGGAIC